MRYLVATLALASALSAFTSSSAADDAAHAAPRQIAIQVSEKGFAPQEVRVKQGEPSTLVFTRVTDRTCMTAIDIPAENVKKLELPLHKPVSLTITPKKKGIEKFHCSAMAMGDGRIIVE